MESVDGKKDYRGPDLPILLTQKDSSPPKKKRQKEKRKVSANDIKN